MENGEKSDTSVNGGERWMALEGGADGSPGEDSRTLALDAARDALAARGLWGG